MKKVSAELFRAVVAVQRVDKSLGDSPALCDFTKNMDITFPGRTYHLLRVLSEAFAQSETDFASMILNHALSETLKILPDVLSDEEFALVEDRIITGLGLSSYLRLQPVFPFQKGLEIPNYAEISNRQGACFGEWQVSGDEVEILDIHTREPIFTFQTSPKPEVSFDGITLQWNGSNVKPLFGEVDQKDTFIAALESADILILGNKGYLFKEDEYTEDFVFAPFFNFDEVNIIKSEEFRKFFRVTEKGGSFTIEPLTAAFSHAKKGEHDSWLCGSVSLRAVSICNVIVSPEE